MEQQTPNYRHYLRDILVEKKKINPQFSLRSFSRMLGVQPTFLSYVLNGKRNLSDEMTAQFIEKLNLTGKKAKIFELLVKLEKTSNIPLKNKILDSLKLVDPSRSKQRDLSVDHFTLISEWYHYVIFMLIDIDDFEWDLQAVARTVGISIFQVKEALERLRVLDLIQYEDTERPVKLEKRILITSPTPNAALMKHFKQLLEMSKNALDQYSSAERFTGTEMITLSHEQLSEASEILEECFGKIIQLSHKKTKQKDIYQLGIQLFPIAQIKTKRKALK